MWHKIGRLRRAKFPNPRGLSRDISHFGLTAGRLMADTYLTAREHLRETTYSLSHLAASQLRLPHPRVQIDPMQVPSFFGTAKLIVNLAQHTAFDAQLVQRLALKLQVRGGLLTICVRCEPCFRWTDRFSHTPPRPSCCR